MAAADRVAHHKYMMKVGYWGVAAGAAIFAALAIAAVVRGRDFVFAGALVCAVAWGGGFSTIIHSAAERVIAELEGEQTGSDDGG